MKTIAGACLRAVSKSLRMREAPRPGEHLDEGRGRLREEGRAGLGRDRLGEQRLAGARRPVQQHAARERGRRGARSAAGSRRNSMISASSALASSTPATSCQRTIDSDVGLELGRRRARHHLHEPPHQVHEEPQQERRDPEDDEEAGSDRETSPSAVAIVAVSTSPVSAGTAPNLNRPAISPAQALRATRSSRGFGR